MGRDTDEFACGVARQLRVRVECDHVSDLLKKFFVNPNVRKTRISVAPQQSIKFLELAAFSLCSHPFLFAFVPLAPTMKKIEFLVLRLFIFLI